MPCASSAFTTSVRPFQCFLLVAQSRPRLKMFCIFWSLFATSCAGREVRNTVLQARQCALPSASKGLGSRMKMRVLCKPIGHAFLVLRRRARA